MDKYSYIANAHGNYLDELFKAYRALVAIEFSQTQTKVESDHWAAKPPTV